MDVVGKLRIPFSAIIFASTFIGVLMEKVDRAYVTMVGSLIALGLLTWVEGRLEISRVAEMIDFATMQLLFSMMIFVHIIACTGFFQWVGVRLAAFVHGRPRPVFFLLSIVTGLLSAFLDNVTTVMLMGPLTLSLANQIGMDGKLVYLSQTISATIGGTATLIGDPPNVVIGSQLDIGFTPFLTHNGVYVVITLVAMTAMNYYRMKGRLVSSGGVKNPDFKKLLATNRITDPRSFLFALVAFVGIIMGLLLMPIHKAEPSWFLFVGMLVASMFVSPHGLRSLLGAVEWDTLLFFASLFVLVESVSELGLIRALGDVVESIIRSAPEGARLEVAIVLFVWFSALGSAFLESLPFTTTITFLIKDLQRQDLGIDTDALIWSLSIGACVGGAGSIMGSSANLVAIGISERYLPKNAIKSADFLRYGLPTVMASMVFATGYLILIFRLIS